MTYDVEVEITYRATVQVEARDRREARAMAERGPSAWYDPCPALDHLGTIAAEAWRQGGDVGVDEMDAWIARRDALLE